MDPFESRLLAVQEEMDLVGDWTDRYRLLVEWGEAEEQLAEEEQCPQRQVAGCSSPLWLRVRWVGATVEVKGASTGVLPRALVALVVRLFDGLDDVSGAVPALLDRLDLRGHLSPTRVLVLETMLERIHATPRTGV